MDLSKQKITLAGVLNNEDSWGKRFLITISDIIRHTNQCNSVFSIFVNQYSHKRNYVAGAQMSDTHLSI
jgi:hypothetical protein